MPKKQKKQAGDEILSVKYKEALSVEEPECSRRTRRGRLVKKPIRYEPDEKVEDDYSGDESNCSSIEDDDLSEDIEDTEGEESESSDDSDADEQGNLKDFVVYSSEEEEEQLELNN